MGYDDPGPSSRTDPYLQNVVCQVTIVTITSSRTSQKSYRPQEIQLLHRYLSQGSPDFRGFLPFNEYEKPRLKTTNYELSPSVRGNVVARINFFRTLA